MISCREYRDLAVEAIYGEIGAHERALFEGHGDVCAKCAAEFADMKATLEVMSARKREEPPPEFWREYWSTLADRLEQDSERRQRGWLRWSHVATNPWVLRPAAAILLIGAGVLIGVRYTRGPGGALPLSPPPRVSELQPEASRQEARPVSIENRAMAYLSRSEVLLLDLVNEQPGADDVGRVDNRRRVSRELLSEAALIEGEMKAPEQRRLRELVSDLEVILLQIANLEARHDLPQIELVRTGVERKGILFKINMERMRATEQPAEPMTTRAPAAGAGI